ncbi:hypothetical protein M0812_23193 [Anaeramoeba flamelloides]|uniref:Uncharacterized protein n=1 Tax=Anaeramoeba flamelloides TaxID=1746091 RepID=A0AAV7YMV4_9EUKA|nr:hypothetical protein M0812_23193 [Anaeramoeba flamelloides]
MGIKYSNSSNKITNKKPLYFKKLKKSSKPIAIFNKEGQIIFFTNKFLRIIGWGGLGKALKNKTLDYISVYEQPDFNGKLPQAKKALTKQLNRTCSAAFRWKVIMADRKSMKIIQVFGALFTISGKLFIQVCIDNTQINKKISDTYSEPSPNNIRNISEIKSIRSLEFNNKTVPLRVLDRGVRFDEIQRKKKRKGNFKQAIANIKKKTKKLQDEKIQVEINHHLLIINNFFEIFHEENKIIFSELVNLNLKKNREYRKKYRELQLHLGTRIQEIEDNKSRKIKLIQENKKIKQIIFKLKNILQSKKFEMQKLLSSIDWECNSKSMDSDVNRNEY